MIETGTHFTLSQRIKLENMLNQRKRKIEIANDLDKNQSTIARELINIIKENSDLFIKNIDFYTK